MNIKAFALMFFVAALSLPLPASTLVADPFPPARFTSLYIQKDENGTSTVIQLVGDAVVYKIMAGGKIVENVTLHPSADDWFNFIQGLNNAKVYKWAPKYEYPGQGISWVVDLAMDDRKLTSEGSNDYPKEGAEDEPVADPKAGPSLLFQLFWQAALTLAGKSPPPVFSK